jgi:hypothetical protein
MCIDGIAAILCWLYKTGCNYLIIDRKAAGANLPANSNKLISVRRLNKYNEEL